MLESELKEMYLAADNFISTQRNCCAKNCSFCCHQQIEILSVEKEPINNFIRNELDNPTKEIISDNLNKWFDYYDQNTPNRHLSSQEVFIEFRDKAAKDSKKCPFLINNLCSIYSMRPLACRMHIVEHSPFLCEQDRQRDTTERVYGVRNFILNEIKKRESELYLEPLSYAVKDVLLPRRKLKTMQKVKLK